MDERITKNNYRPLFDEEIGQLIHQGALQQIGD